MTTVLHHWPSEAELDLLGMPLYAGSLDVAAGHRIVERATAAGVDPDTFTLATHQELWRLLVMMASAGIPVDPVSVAAEIDRNHEDPRLVARLRTLAQSSIPAPFEGVERLAAIVLDASTTRRTQERATA